jgi:hypothetical protein
LLALWLALCVALLASLTHQVELVEETVDSVQTISGLDCIELPDTPDHDPFPLELATAADRLCRHPFQLLAPPFQPTSVALALPPPRRF